MCGITGYINDGKVNESDIQRMNNAVQHRGPDDEGIFIKDNVGIGHRRLSIIDLGTGQQPMSNSDGTVWITFNGEIYNYKDLKKQLVGKCEFKTNSDTEVIIHLYEQNGVDCLKDIRGMFAFAIYDFKRKRLFAARDHLGQKPFYYWHNKNEFAFSSEIKGILALKPELKEMDINALYEYLTVRIITPPRSMFKSIRKLPPAHYLIFENGKLNIERYWSLNYVPKIKGDFNTVTEMLEEQIKESVKYHLVSDVPVGAYLSGGVDSSLVVAIMSQLTEEPVKTFSGDVPYKNYSEIEYARMVAEKYKTESHELRFIPSLIKTLPDIVWHLDEPSDSLSVAMYYISELARKHVKVVLGGEGGDELFGGYDRYYGNLYASYYALIPGAVRKNIFEKALNSMPEGFWYRSLSHKLRWIHQISFSNGGERYSKSLSYFYFSNGYFKQLFSEKYQNQLSAFDPEESIKTYFNSGNANELIDKMLHSDSMIRMPDHPVMILDRMTMAHGLESRAPFLDHKLTEFCAKIPPRFKIKGRKRRLIEIEVAKKYLPHELIFRKKQGFASPITYLLADEYKLLFSKFLKNSRLVEDNYLNEPLINNLLTEHLEMKADHGQRLWLLCNAEIWYRMFIDGMNREELGNILQHIEEPARHSLN
jgi:asparagine synthase (glutamine-hydrolysing)